MEIIFYFLIWAIIIFISIIGFFLFFLILSRKVKNLKILTVFSFMLQFIVLMFLGCIAEILLSGNINIIRIFTIALLVIIALSFAGKATLFKQLPGPVGEKITPPDTKYWELNTGSKIAYWHYTGENKAETYPMLFIHGGPGAHVRNIDREFFKRFAKEGFDIYLYDQPGGGFSECLAIEEYTMERYLEDIESIRNIIGTEKLILIGQSFGALICSAYVSKYKNRVESIIYTSPGELHPPSLSQRLKTQKKREEHGIKYATEILDKFTPPFREAIRFATAILTAKFGCKKMSAQLASQQEMKDYSTRSLPEAIGMSFHLKHADKVPKVLSGGFNIHVNIILQAEYKKISQQIVKRLYNVEIPVLILRAAYDYVDWEATKFYREVFQNSQLVYIPESGHVPWGVNASDSYHAILDFIAGNNENIICYTGESDPLYSVLV